MSRVHGGNPCNGRLGLTGQHAPVQGIILPELNALYRALRARRPPELPPLQITYADYSAWQRARLDSGQLGASVAYWQAQLAGVPVPELPTDRPYPQGGLSAAGNNVRLNVPKDTAAALRRLTAACNTTLYTTLLTAWMARMRLLGRLVAMVLLRRLTAWSCCLYETLCASRASFCWQRLAGTVMPE